MTRLLTVLVLVCAFAQAFSYRWGFGGCPDKQVVKSFVPGDYLGRWYEIERYPQWFENNGKCSQAVYTLGKEPETVDVVNTMIDKSSGEKKQIEGFATIPDANEGKLIVHFTFPIIGERKSPYWILDTDYTNYSLVYSCTNILFVRFESAWILSRKPALSRDSQNKIEEAIKVHDLTRNAFEKTIQDC